MVTTQTTTTTAAAGALARFLDDQRAVDPAAVESRWQRAHWLWHQGRDRPDWPADAAADYERWLDGELTAEQEAAIARAEHLYDQTHYY